MEYQSLEAHRLADFRPEDSRWAQRQTVPFPSRSQAALDDRPHKRSA